ncbi:28S ribosomal protein S5, mitochondrial [Ceratina calcarata]|uniref:Small ribosomal subunit protein uS5m n=1 Tax=Ceratina calcarata TaxID=156304 RepID=A0AAJ7J335_9HYME|nr:28S ribosomal protein S5, mitochondrial [Ceratina calcarata]
MMASRILHGSKTIINCLRNINRTNNATTLLTSRVPLDQHIKLAHTNFFNRRSATNLWKSVTSVSNAGKRRGRGKAVPRMKDLNRGKKLGCGKVPILFPGLNAPVSQGEFVLKQRRLMPKELPQIEVDRPRQITKRRKMKIHPLLRGWSGGMQGGRKIGPPDPIDGEAFEGFETWILYTKHVSVMSSNMGRKKCTRCMVITGNGKGLAGFSWNTSRELRSGLITAKNRAGQRLIHIERYNDHTVLHDFFTQFGRTKIFVKQKQKGYGLVCHRVLRACCEALGIKDMYAKVEGSMNTNHIVKAFFIGLLQQKTHEQMANEKQLHLVEIRKENNYFPTVLASPPKARRSEEIPPGEDLDFKLYIMNGRVPLAKKPRVPFYTKLPSWLIHLRKQERQRGQKDVVIRSLAEYGSISSFLTEKYPEATAYKNKKKKKQDEDSIE